MSAAIGRPAGNVLTIGEAAKLAWLSRDGIDHLIRRGVLPAARAREGRRVVIASDVLAVRERFWSRV